MTREEIFNLITRHTSDVLPSLADHNFASTDSLKDLGANSIDRSEIVMMVLDSLSLSIPLIETMKAGNIGELAELLHAKITKA